MRNRTSDFYKNYLQLLNEQKKGNKHLFSSMTEKTSYVLKKMNVYTYNTSDRSYDIKLLNEIEFNTLQAEVFGKRLIYVFNTKNQLIYCSHKVSLISFRYSIAKSSVHNKLEKQYRRYHDFYVSYDKDFKIPPINTTGDKLKDTRPYGQKLKENAMLAVKKIAEELRANEELLKKDLNDIAEHYNVKRYTVLNWGCKYDFFRSVLNHRKKILPKPKKKDLIKIEHEEIYDIYVFLHNASKNKGFDINEYAIIPTRKSLLFKLGLIEKRNKKVIFKPLLDKFKFTELIAKYKNVKPIYIFNQENKLIDCSYNTKYVSKAYHTHLITIRKRLKNPNCYSSTVYLSYDKDFKITAVKPVECVKYCREGIEINSYNRAKKMKQDLTNNPQYLELPYKELEKVLDLSYSTIHRYFKKYDFLAGYEKKIKSNKKKLQAQEAEKIKEQKRIERENQRKVQNVLKSRENAKKTKKVLSAEEVLKIAKMQNKPAKHAGKLGEQGLKERLKNIK